MSNLAQRLLLFFVALPLLLLSVLYLPQAHHGIIILILLGATTGSALELASLLGLCGLAISRLRAGIIGFLVPAAFYASTFFPGQGLGFLGMALAIVAIIFFAPFAYSSKESLPKALGSTAATSLVLMYPGLLGGMAALVVAGFPRGAEAILTYAAMVFGNDSLAWLFGVSFGKKRNLFPVSPNKSLAGFIGGFLGSILGGMGIFLLFPAAFPTSWPWILLMALAMGIAVITGDLFESSLKRSAGAKDSGSIIPGRGGILDSFDSLLYSAPVFYLFAHFLGLFR
jgi:phosphatidate cytidylyltransferase